MSLIYTFYRADRSSKELVTKENCFYIETTDLLLWKELLIIKWLLTETFEPHGFSSKPFIVSAGPEDQVVEIGSRLNFATAWNTNALSILRACGITEVTRIEQSRRYRVPSGQNADLFIRAHCDRMTEMVYRESLATFETGIKPEAVYTIPLTEEGPDALAKILGISMDAFDRQLYYEYFVEKCGRNPTIVEIMDLNNANSEHSRHGYFKGLQVIDGVEMPETLMEIVKSTLKANPGNSVLAFCDNSSVIRGYEVKTIIPYYPGRVSAFSEREPLYHILFTAETHNFPSGVAPFPGAETGTGGRIRDVQATGRGALVIAGTAAYCVGNLLIPGYDLPWEDKNFVYPGNLASPLKILIDASNGASDYGNKFGEPVIQGFARSFGLLLPDDERREWIKPIMFTGGVGQIENLHIKKEEAEEGMLIVQVGGLAYRIGFGGGAASSMLQGENKAELDFNAVQRGDAEMEQKMNRVIRACIERWHRNPIVSIHDQGAGGPANVLKELVEKAGGCVYIDRINLGDPTLSILEIWVCEYQERNGMLIYKNRLEEFKEICAREKVPCEVLGEVTGDGKFTVFAKVAEEEFAEGYIKPVDLDLADVLGNMPQKTFSDTRVTAVLKRLKFSEDFTVREALECILKLVSVGSKRFLTNKVDRSVTGLIAQQQCVGPLQLTLSNVAVISQSHFPNEKGKYTGAVIAIGERPIIGLINPAAQGRMTVAEMLTNIMWAKVSKLEDIKCSGNWMCAPKLPGEGAKLYDVAVAMRDIMLALGIAVDGGKDSLSMATKVKESGELVKSPNQLVISGYCTMLDITKVITPDIKKPGESKLLFIDLANGRRRLGGSALAHVYGQIGDECPDVGDTQLLKNAFNAIQEMIDGDLILAGHDVSDGGLIVTLLEMAFAGNCGLTFTVPYFSKKKQLISHLFAEECGLVLEVGINESHRVINIIHKYGLYKNMSEIGWTVKEPRINTIMPMMNCTDEYVLKEDMRVLRSIWEETSHRLQIEQGNLCAEEEKRNIYNQSGMKFRTSFKYGPTPKDIMAFSEKPKVAIIREEGSNGDREMTSAFYQAGFECWDVTMTDLLENRVTLEGFRGVTFVGGFSYADVLDSAKGWAGVIRFNEKLRITFDEFYNRPDTFSLGVCNGCQLMALLGWVPFRGLSDIEQPRFIKNKSGRFESRFSAVHISKSPAVMLQGMEGLTLGVWVAHSEGRMYFPEEKILKDVFKQSLAPMRFVDDSNTITENYPFNPNGSPLGITALCSPDGRHLAIMPHPERAFLKWQWPYQPEDWKDASHQISPWLKMFQNAREWCEK